MLAMLVQVDMNKHYKQKNKILYTSHAVHSKPFPNYFTTQFAIQKDLNMTYQRKSLFSAPLYSNSIAKRC